MDIALSPNQVRQIAKEHVGLDIPVVMYDDIIQCQNIDQLLGENNTMVIFYPAFKDQNVTMGHYTCLIKNTKHKTYYYYDPLAYNIDEYKKFTFQRNQLYQEKQNSLVKHMLKKLNNGYVIDFNNHQHQSRKPDVSTCGYHCVSRIKYASVSNDDYDRLLKMLKKLYRNQVDSRGKLYDKLIYFIMS